MPIDLTIVSADRTMIGTGPSLGKSIENKGLIIAGTDPISTDTVSARLLGFLPQAIHYLYTLHKKRIGEGDLKKIELKGIGIKKAEEEFSINTFNKRIVLDDKGIKNIHGNK
ncbi:DUF362 domain-containing protein [Dethiothermospora halolimnae]|uniref:DUF362 domain-containing protein n=1 Tax=Dethiothermospora halolimnae TaxID=3114390 RepID=UPI003CCBB4A3